MTLRQIHFKFFEYQKFLFEENQVSTDESFFENVQEAYNKIFNRQHIPYRVLINIKFYSFYKV